MQMLELIYAMHTRLVMWSFQMSEPTKTLFDGAMKESWVLGALVVVVASYGASLFVAVKWLTNKRERDADSYRAEIKDLYLKQDAKDEKHYSALHAAHDRALNILTSVNEVLAQTDLKSTEKHAALSELINFHISENKKHMEEIRRSFDHLLKN